MVDTTTVGVHFDYFRTFQGILKIVQVVCSVIFTICALVSSGYGKWNGSGWSGFVGFICMFVSISAMILFLTSFIAKIPGPTPLLLFVIYLVTTLLLLTAVISTTIACHSYGGKLRTATGFASALGYLGFLAFAADVLFFFSAFRQNIVEIVQPVSVAASGSA